MLYTEESPLIERGVEPLSIKHKQGLRITQRISSYYLT